jgi:hypothetical protein
MKHKHPENFLIFRCCACLAFLALLSVNTAAQTKTDDTPTQEFQIWGGGSPASSTVFGSGRTSDARLGMIGLRYARRFNNSDTVNLKYTFDAIPAAALSVPSFRGVPNGNTFVVQKERRTAYAYGIAPLGLQINFRPHKKLQPFIGGSVGLLYFNKRVPDEFGTRFTYTAEVGGGAEIRFREKRALTIGYKYLHLSNGGRGTLNPGIDNNFFYVGYSFYK